MAGSEILEVAIGIVFIFLVTSLIASGLRELIEAWLKTRAVQLERGIRILLDDPSGTAITNDLFDHPQLYGLFSGDYEPEKLRNFTLRDPPGGTQGQPAKRMPLNSSLPNYIPSRNFALALMDIVGGSGAGAGPLSIESVKASALTLPDSRVKQAIVTALGEAEGSIDRMRLSLEAWYDSNMDRVSGWYKRETQWILLGLGFLIAAAVNIDAIHIAQRLARDNVLRGNLTVTVERELAEATKAGSTGVARQDGKGAKGAPDAQPDKPQDPSAIHADLKDFSDAIGWADLEARALQAWTTREAALAKAAGDSGIKDAIARKTWAHRRMGSHDEYLAWQIVLALPGWLLTALAASLGAPFWFDILNKFMVIRSTIKPFEKSAPVGSADRASTPPPSNVLAGGGAGGGPAQPPAAAAPPTPTKVTVRVAVDVASYDAGSVALTVDGAAVVVPPDGMLEVPLAIGQVNQLKLTGTKAGQQVSTSLDVPTNLNTQNKPIWIA